MKYNTGKQLKILILIVICFSICGCDRATADPHIAYGLLLKCRDFLSFCLFLTNQEKPYFNHIAQRYYYATLLLASITYQWQKKQGREFVVFSKHEDVWKIMPHNIKQPGLADLPDRSPPPPGRSRYPETTGSDPGAVHGTTR